MATKKGNFGNTLFTFTLVLSFYVSSNSAISTTNEIVHFNQLDFLPDSQRNKRESDTFSANFKNDGTVRRRRELNTDSKCNNNIVNAEALSNSIHNYTFDDSNENLALMWTGTTGQSILALTTLEYSIFAAPSHLWLSNDFGKTFEQIDHKVESATIRATNGIFRNMNDPEKLILVPYSDNSDSTKLFLTVDGGGNFDVVEAPFYPEGPFLYHKTRTDWILAHSPNQNYKLWISKDFGRNWRSIKEDVVEYNWGTKEQGTEDMIYMAVKLPTEHVNSVKNVLTYTLMKADHDGNSVTEIKKNIYNFGSQGKFLFVATDIEGDVKNKTKILHVSTDGGDTWHITQLPGIHDDMFFSVLDMSEGMIILHVDDFGDTGMGKIYTSDADGLVFSLSLDMHLFPNGNTVTDFYKVQSMRGVYMASQLDKGNNLHTMITFDRGGIWDYVKAPKDATCSDKICNLQIHNRYSQLKSIKVPSIPLSIPTAPGLILAHGNIASGLDMADPDVYVTSDGGYNWTKALDGPHQYAVTNFGGLILAIPKHEDTTDTIRFSYDEGHCWHSYKFSNEKMVITGLLPEPSSKSLNISIWGFGASDRMWRTFTIDFSVVLSMKCTKDDFIKWSPHDHNGKDGCLLGLKESFRKVKPDALCQIDYEFEFVSNSTKCQCEKQDYECDFGYYRKDESTDCNISPYIKPGEIDICKMGEEYELFSAGYRKIPGDQCKGGYKPFRNVEDLKKQCPDWEMESMYAINNKHSKSVVMLLLFVIFIIVLMIASVIVKKQGFVCAKKSIKIYSYSKLTQGVNQDEAIDLSPQPDTYHDDSDDDILGEL